MSRPVEQSQAARVYKLSAARNVFTEKRLRCRIHQVVGEAGNEAGRADRLKPPHKTIRDAAYLSHDDCSSKICLLFVVRCGQHAT